MFRELSPRRLLLTWQPHYADVAQLVEHNLAKVGVAGSNPVVRSNKPLRYKGFLALSSLTPMRVVDGFGRGLSMTKPPFPEIPGGSVDGTQPV